MNLVEHLIHVLLLLIYSLIRIMTALIMQNDQNVTIITVSGKRYKA